MNVLADALKLWPGSIPKLSFLEKLLHPAADPPPALVTALKVSAHSSPCFSMIGLIWIADELAHTPPQDLWGRARLTQLSACSMRDSICEI